MTSIFEAARFRPHFKDRSKHRDQMIRRTVQVFKEEDAARAWAKVLRREKTRPGQSRSTRVVRKWVNVHGFGVELWFIVHRIRHVA